MTTGMLSLSADQNHRYLVTPDRTPAGAYSRQGSAGFVSAHPRKSATNFTHNHAWFGSIQLPSEDHELRVRELQRLAQRKVNDEPGPFESNVYTPVMQQRASRYKRYVSQGRKQQYVSVGDQQTHLVEVETHVFQEVPPGTSFSKAARLAEKRDFRGDGAGPAPGYYQAGRHAHWRRLDRVGNRSKSCGHARGATESRKGQYAHLATGRDNSSPVPRVRAPSLAYAMQQGHDWRALLKLQRPTGEPAYLGPHPLNNSLHAAPDESLDLDLQHERQQRREQMLKTLARSSSAPPSPPQRPASVSAASAPRGTTPPASCTPHSREVHFHRSTYRAISPDPKFRPSRSPLEPQQEPARARSEALQPAALQSPPFSPEAHAALDELADGDYPQHGVSYPRSGSRASSLAKTTLITPKMQLNMQRAYHARHTAEAVREKSNQWKLRNLVGPA